MSREKQVSVERRYCSEYVLKNYPPNTRVRYNAPIGLPSKEFTERFPERDIRFFKPWRKYVDAIVPIGVYLDIIECKIWAPEKGITDLLEYRELLDETPELAEFKDLINRLILVVPFIRPHWERMTKRYEINLIIWRPDWVVPHLKKRGLI